MAAASIFLLFLLLQKRIYERLEFLIRLKFIDIIKALPKLSNRFNNAFSDTHTHKNCRNYYNNYT